MCAMVNRGLYPQSTRAEQTTARGSRERRIRATWQRNIVFRVEPIGELDQLEQEWRCLEAEASPSFFVSWNWIGTLLELLPPETRPRLLRGTESGRTVALALLGETEVRRHRILRTRRWVLNATGDPMFDAICLEHNRLLACRHIGWDGLFDTFLEAGDVDEIGLPGIAVPPPEELVERRGLFRKGRTEMSFAVELGALTAADGDVAAVLSHNARSQLRRAVRRLQPLSLDVASSTAEALSFFQTLKQLHISWWERRGQPHAFTYPFFECFHQRLIERVFDDGAVQLLRIRSGDRTIGILYNFRRGNRVYAYQSGFVDPEAHERPGVVAHALAIQRAWQEGAETYDFLAGENRLKRSFGTRTESLSWTVVQKPRLHLRIEHWFRGGTKRMTLFDFVDSRTNNQKPRRIPTWAGPEEVRVESP